METGLEPVGYRGEVDAVVGGETHRTASEGHWPQILQDLPLPVHDTHPGGTEHLVDGHAIDVHIGLLQVHGHVRSGLCPIHHDDGTLVMGDLGDRTNRQGASGDVVAVLDRDDLHLGIHAPVEGFDVETPVGF